MTKYTVHTVTFPEMIGFKKASPNTSNYDLHVGNITTEQNYCTALFQKIMELPLSELQKFIEYKNMVGFQVIAMNTHFLTKCAGR